MAAGPPKSPCNDGNFYFIFPASGDNSYASVTAAANEELAKFGSGEYPRLHVPDLPDDELSTTNKLDSPQDHCYTHPGTPLKENTGMTATVGATEPPPVTPSPSQQNARLDTLGISDADQTKMQVSNALDDVQVPLEAYTSAFVGGNPDMASMMAANPALNDSESEDTPHELFTDVNQDPTVAHSTTTEYGEWQQSFPKVRDDSSIDFDCIFDAPLNETHAPTNAVAQVLPPRPNQPYLEPQGTMMYVPSLPNQPPTKPLSQVPSASNKRSRPKGKIKSTRAPSSEPTFFEEEDLDRTISVVRGQGNVDQGMRAWIEKTERVRTFANESNLDSLALQVVTEFKNEGGMFFDKKLVGIRKQGSKKKVKREMYFEMSDEDAVELTVETLCRQYTTLKSDVDVVMGRGGGGNHNPGNHVWRGEIQARKQAYLAIPTEPGRRNDKTNISRQIVANVSGRGGRFITDETCIKGMFYLIPDKLAVKKTSQGLRERRT